MPGPDGRVLLVYSRPARFVEIDRDLLRERFDVRELGGTIAPPWVVVREVARSDVVVGWFASWHALLPLLAARVLRRPSLLIVGGFDTARVPEIGYGYQLGGARRVVARTCMALATRLMTNSEYSRGELREHVGRDAAVVHHGIHDLASLPPDGPRDPVAVTVSNVARIALERKGLRPFVEAGAHAPDVEFVLVGKAVDDAAAELERAAAPNVRLAGRLGDEELAALLGRARAYVQASRHEGFGMALAEAMLAGCVPVATRAGALPEVIGEAPAVWLDDPSPAAIAEGVRQAARFGPEERRRVRERILTAFPLEVRRSGLLRLVEELQAARGRRDGAPRAA